MSIDYEKLKKVLQGLAENQKNKDLVRKKNNEQDKSEVLKALSKDLGGVLKPFIDELRLNSKMSADELSRVIAESVKIDAPSVDTESIKQAILDAMSQVRVTSPNITIPDIRIPDVKMPDKMSIEGWVGLMGVDLQHPLPVQLRDADGKPVNIGQMTTAISGGGGKADHFTIKGFSNSAFATLLNPDGRLKVELPTGASGLTDTELRATAVPVSQVSGANWSVFASLDTTATLYNGDNRLRVSLETGGSGLTDAELRATAVPVSQVSGAIDSVYVTGFSSSVAATIIDSSGVGYSGSNPLPITETPVYDYLSLTETSGTDVYVYKTGGAGGSTVRTITIVYASESKATVSTITYT